ncbi:hypothetical protein SY88_16760 [Clostridiales bacterium PH28_bin88]|nr:hypothetical protein SY88_16760 [Clostridiales bacterium PH28_bin88]
MKDLPYKARIFILLVFCSGCILALNLFRLSIDTPINWGGFLLFLILTVLSDSLPVSLPRGGQVTVSFALVFASILLFPPFVAVLVAILGDLLSSKRERPYPLHKYLFNSGQLILSVGLAALTYHLLNGRLEPVFMMDLLPIMTALLVDVGINIGLVTIVMALAQEVSPWAIWATNFRWMIPNLMALAPLGVLIALVFRSTGGFGVLLFFVPLLIARHSFQSYMDMRQSFLDTIQSLAAAIDAKDPYTRGHSERVARYAVAIAREMKRPEDQVEQLQYIAVLHDAGKIGIPEAILNKPGSLDRDEFAQMQHHAAIGAEIVANVKMLASGADIVRHHHEKWDGKGYPDGLVGAAIPLGSRIIAVADAFDAMTSDRPYRPARAPEAALEEIKGCSGRQFDPGVVKAFINVYPSLNLSNKAEQKTLAEAAAAREEVASHRQKVPIEHECGDDRI